jgi:hypothetical protein
MDEAGRTIALQPRNTFMDVDVDRKRQVNIAFYVGAQDEWRVAFGKMDEPVNNLSELA